MKSIYFRDQKKKHLFVRRLILGLWFLVKVVCNTCVYIYNFVDSWARVSTETQENWDTTKINDFTVYCIVSEILFMYFVLLNVFQIVINCGVIGWCMYFKRYWIKYNSCCFVITSENFMINSRIHINLVKRIWWKTKSIGFIDLSMVTVLEVNAFHLL